MLAFTCGWSVKGEALEPGQPSPDWYNFIEAPLYLVEIKQERGAAQGLVFLSLSPKDERTCLGADLKTCQKVLKRNPTGDFPVAVNVEVTLPPPTLAEGVDDAKTEELSRKELEKAYSATFRNREAIIVPSWQPQDFGWNNAELSRKMNSEVAARARGGKLRELGEKVLKSLHLPATSDSSGSVFLKIQKTYLFHCKVIQIWGPRWAPPEETGPKVKLGLRGFVYDLSDDPSFGT